MDLASFLSLLKTLGPILGLASAGRAAGKTTEANLAQGQNQDATSRYQALVNAGRLQNIEQPSANMDQATRGSVLSTWKPYTYTSGSVPYGSKTSGPIRGSSAGGPTMTPELQQLGAQVTRDALARQLAGNTLDTSTFPSDSELGLNALPTSSWLDKLLGGASAGASIAGAFAKPTAGAVAGAGGPGITAGSTTFTPGAAGASSKIPMPGFGQGNPSTSAGWYSLLQILKRMQQGQGGDQYRSDNPFAPSGSSIGQGGGISEQDARLTPWRRPPLV